MARQSAAEVAIAADFTPKKKPTYLDAVEIARGLFKHGGEMFCGTTTGTGSAIDVPTPFDPAVVILFNETAPCLAIKMPSMAGDDSIKIVAAGTMTYVTSNMITLGVKKFTIGSDADINTAAEVTHWIALGARDVGGSL